MNPAEREMSASFGDVRIRGEAREERKGLKADDKEGGDGAEGG